MGFPVSNNKSVRAKQASLSTLLLDFHSEAFQSEEKTSHRLPSIIIVVELERQHLSLSVVWGLLPYRKK